jgi:hypothetical protein
VAFGLGLRILAAGPAPVRLYSYRGALVCAAVKSHSPRAIRFLDPALIGCSPTDAVAVAWEQEHAWRIEARARRTFGDPGHTALEDLDALGLDKRPNSSISPAMRSGSSIYTPDDLRNRAQASVAVVKVDALAPECDEGVPPRQQAPLVIENEPGGGPHTCWTLDWI